MFLFIPDFIYIKFQLNAWNLSQGQGNYNGSLEIDKSTI